MTLTLGHKQRYLTDFRMERDGAEAAEIRQSTFLERIGGSYEQNATFPFDKAQAKSTHSNALCARLHIDQKMYLDGCDSDTHYHRLKPLNYSTVFLATPCLCCFNPNFQNLKPFPVALPSNVGNRLRDSLACAEQRTSMRGT